MWHTTTPTESGWYWVCNNPDDDLSWQMVYFDVEVEPRIYAFCPDVIRVMAQSVARVTIWRPEAGGDGWNDEAGWWRGPELWVGPLQMPGGPFGSNITEFAYETYLHAKEAGKAMVMEHRDDTFTTGYGTTTVVSLEGMP